MIQFLIAEEVRTDSTDMGDFVRMDPIGGNMAPDEMPERVIVMDTKEFHMFLDHLKCSKKRCNGNVHRIARTKSILNTLRNTLEKNG